MKIRNGFVSNSSSSSFCIYKKLMTEEQIEKFRCFINDDDREDSWETAIVEDGDYFIGNLGMHDEILNEWIRKTFIPGIQYATFC